MREKADMQHRYSVWHDERLDMAMPKSGGGQKNIGPDQIAVRRAVNWDVLRNGIGNGAQPIGEPSCGLFHDRPCIHMRVSFRAVRRK